MSSCPPPKPSFTSLFKHIHIAIKLWIENLIVTSCAIDKKLEIAKNLEITLEIYKNLDNGFIHLFLSNFSYIRKIGRSLFEFSKFSKSRLPISNSALKST